MNMEMSLFKNLKLDDIDFNLDINLEVERDSMVPDFEKVDDEGEGDYFSQEMSRRLSKMRPRFEEGDDKTTKKQLLVELFGEESDDEEDIPPQELEEMEKIKTRGVELLDNNRGIFKNEVDDKKIIEIINEGRSSDDQFILEENGEEEKEEALEKYPLSEEYVVESDQEDTDDTIGKVITPSFEEKLEKVKEEIEKINLKETKTRKGKKKGECPEDKELNPKTGRCVKKCERGYVRDKDTFKCVKSKK